ncbi:hypothetical protein G6L28_21155 [Agrobacterium larrymoorei]|uniref:LysR substrate-binding domain-containing protein n=1 Tax=Agrobacterium larrymoorei TaxID=160699 RepID=UPI001572E467|nr:hypothetical protein [Agrobacterium larrymoorei]
MPQLFELSADGNTWNFVDKAGLTVSVEINPVISSSDAQILVDSAVNSSGVCLASIYTVYDQLRTGSLVRVLPDFKVSPLWIKAVVPERKSANASIQYLISCFRKALEAASELDV